MTDHSPLPYATELHLDAHGSVFGDAALALYIPLIASSAFPSLEVLNLGNAGLTDGGLIGLVDALARALASTGRPLARLDVGGNGHTDAGVRALAVALADKKVRVREGLVAGGPAVTLAALEALAVAWKGEKATGAAEVS